MACGMDTISIRHAYQKKFRYSIISPYFENKDLKKEFKHTLKYIKPNYIKLSKYIRNNVHGIISSDMDYHIPYIGTEKYLGMIPNPINIDILMNTGVKQRKSVVTNRGKI